MKKKLLIILIVLHSSIAFSQAILEDASGESTLYLSADHYTWFRLNTSSSSATMGFNFFKFSDNGFDIESGALKLNFMAGLDANISIKDGIGKVTENGLLSPDVGSNFNFGFSSDAYGDSDMSFFIRGEYTYKSFNLANATSADTLYFDKFTGWTRNLRFIYNLVKDIGSSEKPSQLFVGASYSVSPFSRFNNEDLTPVTLSTTQNTATNGQMLSKTATGIKGELQRIESNPFRVDIGILPSFTKNIVGFNGYYSVETNSKTPVANIGMGIFFAKENKPKSIIGGISYQLNDINNDKDATEKKVLKRSTAFFYVGYVFNSK